MFNFAFKEMPPGSLKKNIYTFFKKLNMFNLHLKERPTPALQGPLKK